MGVAVIGAGTSATSTSGTSSPTPTSTSASSPTCSPTGAQPGRPYGAPRPERSRRHWPGRRRARRQPHHPGAHADVAHRALQAGKHVWNEKPLATSREDAESLVAEPTGSACGWAAHPTPCSARASRPPAVWSSGNIGRPLTASIVMQQAARTTGTRTRISSTRPGRAAAGHGPVLPDRADPGVRADRPGRRARLLGRTDPGDRERAAGR